MISILCWIVFGFFVGSIAKLIHPGDDNLGFWTTSGLGVAGSFLGGLINYVFHFDHFHPAGFLMSILGSVICCALWRHWNLKNSKEGPRDFFTGKLK